jgi:hypothetical protein
MAASPSRAKPRRRASSREGVRNQAPAPERHAVPAPVAGRPRGESRISGAEPRLQGLHDLAGLGEAPGLFLGEDQLVAERDVEDAARALDQVGLNAELALDLVRQTGGSRVVVSDRAVLDRDVLGHAAIVLLGRL